MSGLPALSQAAIWEGVAVLCALAYLVLAIRERVACWFFALASTAIYTVLFHQVSLLMDSLLNIYYMVLAVYGWWVWRRGMTDPVGDVAIRRFSAREHRVAIGVTLAATMLAGTLLDRFTGAAWPYVDAFTTFGSVITTWMVTRKILENWLYWMVIDAVAIPLYIERGLPLTAALFALYLVLCVIGWRRWRAGLVGAQGSDLTNATIAVSG